MKRPADLFKERPAESAMPLTTVVAILIAKALGVQDTDTIAYLAIALSFVPAVVTWIVTLVRREPDDTGTTYHPSTGV